MMKLALSLLCENPVRKTGLTSLFHEFVLRSVRQNEDVEWLVYVGPEFEWEVDHERVRVIRKYPGNNDTVKRLFADHFLLGPDAKKRGVDVLVTVGLVPMRTGGLPVAMHMLSLQHLNPDNKVSLARRIYRGWAASSGLTKADLIITNTRFAVNQILSVNPEVEDKMVQSYEGLQHEFYVPQPEEGEELRLKEKFGISPGYLYWCSNFYKYKQPEKFFEAYALLTREEREELPVVLVGGGGWGDGIDHVMAYAESLGIRDNVTHLGWVDDEDLAALYRNARMFCLASREETFGRCVIEAMACGTPCVVNNIEVMHEVTDGKAVIVDFDDAERVATSFRRLLWNEDEYTKLREASIKRARDFDFEILAKERIEAIRQLLQ